MDAIDELLARDRIRQLAQRYALGVDAKDLDGIAVLFAEDVTNGRYGPGRAGVKMFFDHALRAFHCSMHLVANHVIDFDDDDHAHGVVYCRAQHHVLEPDHWFDQALAYWDTYEHIGDDWYFRRGAATSSPGTARSSATRTMGPSGWSWPARPRDRCGARRCRTRSRRSTRSGLGGPQHHPPEANAAVPAGHGRRQRPPSMSKVSPVR
jgi:hypothetical protein